jgi:hypothetical protein
VYLSTSTFPGADHTEIYQLKSRRWQNASHQRQTCSQRSSMQLLRRGKRKNRMAMAMRKLRLMVARSRQGHFLKRSAVAVAPTLADKKPAIGMQSAASARLVSPRELGCVEARGLVGREASFVEKRCECHRLGRATHAKCKPWRPKVDASVGPSPACG